MNADDYVTYEEFGRKFFEVDVTEERVGAALRRFTQCGQWLRSPPGLRQVGDDLFVYR